MTPDRDPPRPMTREQEKVWGFIEGRLGRAKAVSPKLIAKAVGWEEAKVRGIEKTLVQVHRLPIVAVWEEPSGYFIPQTREEVEAYIVSLLRHNRSINQRILALMQSTGFRIAEIRLVQEAIQRYTALIEIVKHTPSLELEEREEQALSHGRTSVFRYMVGEGLTRYRADSWCHEPQAGHFTAVGDSEGIYIYQGDIFSITRILAKPGSGGMDDGSPAGIDITRKPGKPQPNVTIEAPAMDILSHGESFDGQTGGDRP